MNVNREEMEKISEEVGQVIADVQEARKQSRQAEWFSLAALTISVIPVSYTHLRAHET